MQYLNPIYPDVIISPLAAFYGRLDLLKIGKGSRIDAFCLITIGDEGLEIGEKVHIGAGTQLFGSGGKISIGNCVSISPRTSLFTSTDNLSGNYLVGPTVPLEVRNVLYGSIRIESYAAIGCGSVILPNVRLGRGSSVGALSIVKKDVSDYTVVVGPDQKTIAVKNGETIEKMGILALQDENK